jgi:hypothetical protein
MQGAGLRSGASVILEGSKRWGDHDKLLFRRAQSIADLARWSDASHAGEGR